MGPEMLLVPIPERLQNNLTNSNRTVNVQMVGNPSRTRKSLK
jgi:hypothetical protein